MRALYIASFLLLMLCGLATTTVAEEQGSLFINMTSDDSHRATMGIGFGQSQLGRGHPVTIFLNDRGVHMASSMNASQYAAQQSLLADIMAKGGTVYACPSCLKHYGIAQADLMKGIRVSNPELTGSALFTPGTRTMSW